MLGLLRAVLTFSLLHQPDFQIPRCPEMRGQACSLPGKKKGVQARSQRAGSNPPDFTQVSDRACSPAQRACAFSFFSVLFDLEGGSKVCIGAGLEGLGHEDLGLVGLRDYAFCSPL